MANILKRVTEWAVTTLDIVSVRLMAGKDSSGNLVALKVAADGSIATGSNQLSGAPSNFTPATADATVFTLAGGEVGFIQNLSADAPLAVKKGAGASTSSFSLILNACTVQDDGKGGDIEIDDFVGVVSVAKITGTARYIAYKQASS